jgi:uncharacterized membrane protein YdjX (TVP38/TMEM64 family)
MARPRGLLARFAPLACLVAVALAAYWSGLPHLLTPEALAREQGQLHAAVAAAPALAVAAFVLAYAVIVATCIPVALMLSLIAGLVFGPWLGSAAVLLGATGAALLTYAAARSAFAPALIARAERDARMGRVIDSFGRNAFSYILTTRLLPFVPFGLVNIAAGLAAVPVRAYAAATLIGGVPAAVIYANLGAGLGSSLGSEHALHAALHSPQLLVPLSAMAVLSLAPMVAKRLSRSKA